MRTGPHRTTITACAAGVMIAAAACSRPPTLDDGRQLYRGNGCATCHGPLGHGDGPVGRTLTPPPRDFRDARAFKNGTSVEAIAKTLQDGLTREGSQMPRFDHLSRRERESLSLFVISIRNQSESDTTRRTP